MAQLPVPAHGNVKMIKVERCRAMYTSTSVDMTHHHHHHQDEIRCADCTLIAGCMVATSAISCTKLSINITPNSIFFCFMLLRHAEGRMARLPVYALASPLTTTTTTTTSNDASKHCASTSSHDVCWCNGPEPMADPSKWRHTPHTIVIATGLWSCLAESRLLQLAFVHGSLWQLGSNCVTLSVFEVNYTVLNHPSLISL